ncbi:hypothetical protein GF312_06720 [Candidatus Poribacteria bacterium]|nr:hypothetical protein [Candidatus Poribacteria bacterium]
MPNSHNKTSKLLLCLLYLTGVSYFIYPAFSYSDNWTSGTPQLIERAWSVLDFSVENPTLAPKNPHAPAPNPRIGVQERFYAVDFSRSRAPYFTNATCRAVGDFCYIFVQDSQWQKGTVNHDDIIAIKKAFDQSTNANPSKGIYETEVENLGFPPDDIDQDPKIYILVLDIPDGREGTGSYLAGYFEPLNQKRGVFRDPHTGVKITSNEVEMIYLDAHPLDVGSNTSKEILAHEFQHLIHWKHDPDEDIWLNEGCSEYAAIFLCGYGGDKSMHVRSFEMKPQTSLVYWSGLLENYGASFLWVLYLHEQYGGVSTISALIDEQDNGIKGINDVLSNRGYSRNFSEVFSDWKIANIMDDTSYANGRYGYKNLDLNLRIDTRHASYPTERMNNIQSWTADYIQFSNGDGISDLLLDFNGKNPAHSFDIKIISMLNGRPVGIEKINLAKGLGYLSLPDFGISSHDIIMAVSWQPRSRPDFSDIIQYSYSARLGEKIEINTAVIPNPIHNRYIDILVKINDVSQTNIPRINVSQNGKVIIKQQIMSGLESSSNREKAAYIYQLYIPKNMDKSSIDWEIYYTNRIVANGNLGELNDY